MASRGRGSRGRGGAAGGRGTPFVRGGRGSRPGGSSFSGHDDRGGGKQVVKNDRLQKTRRGGGAVSGRGRGRGLGIDGDTVCFYFSKYGHCARGASCKFQHVKRESSSVTKVDSDFLFRHFEMQKAHDASITAMAQSEEGIYTVSQDKKLKRWKPAQLPSGLFELRADLEVPLPEQCFAILYKEGWIFCGLWDGSIQVYSKSGDNTILKGHCKKVSSLIVHEGVLISGGSDQEVRLWQMNAASKSWVCTHTIKDGVPGAVHKLLVVGPSLVIGGSNGVAICSLTSLTVTKILPPLKFVADFLEFQGHIVAAYSDGGVRVFDGDGAMKSELKPCNAGPILSMGGLTCGPRIVCTHSKGQVSTILLPDFQFKCTYQAFDSGRVESVHCEMHGNQGLYLLGHQSGTLHLWQRAPPPAAA